LSAENALMMIKNLDGWAILDPRFRIRRMTMGVEVGQSV
jgi:hypothetical protein